MSVKVTITGPRGSGKTNAAIQIKKALEEAGFSEFVIEDVHEDDIHKNLPVSGYQAELEAVVQLMNQNKYREEKLLRLIDGLMLGRDTENIAVSVDKRWLAIARTDIETGFMALNRAISQPKRIQGKI